ncbi:hypothetical protein E0W68_01925 [Flavobacterium salilacus subsp. salilacus]|uniref:hypothetical protein n=1 Tax=Flavobacterium TaxID=237 RepID=UPI0010749F0A|nr:MULTISPECIES: hypothetical protein [Flavobacterium]KAF2520008.1 hypothetical protein E0W68_01925 [Flavobacterium salilacus subsp. salilacus]MBE1614076.1 hypothetical protein [Flavobacterium sp. SaA2.13]
MKDKSKIQNFTDLYEETVGDNTLLSSFVKGHLAVEFLLKKIIELAQPKLLDFAEGLNHFKLIHLVYGLEYISEGQKETLLLINQVRNKFAHQITFEPSIYDLIKIFMIALDSFTDMTDGIMQGLDEMEGKVSINECDEWVIPELFVQICYDLHSICQEFGADIEDF